MTNKFKASPTHWILIIALLFAGYACYLLIQPTLNSIIMAFIISLLIHPLHELISKKLPRSPNFSAFLSCLLLVLIIVIPLSAIVMAIIGQGRVFSQSLHAWLSSGGDKALLNHPYVVNIFNLINDYLPFDTITPQDVAQRATEFLTQFSSIIVSASATILGNATSLLMNFFLMLFVMFFLLRDHDKIHSGIRHIIPLSRSQEDRLLSEIHLVSKSAILGSFLTAIAQAIAGGIALWIVGLPALFWGTMMGAASFIPIVGTALIWLPASIYLILTHEVFWGIFLIIWGVAVIGSIDNIVRPLLMQGSGGMDTLMIFFALLGGINLFGMVGLIYGPLIFAITIVLFKMYEEEFKDFLTRQDNS